MERIVQIEKMLVDVGGRWWWSLVTTPMEPSHDCHPSAREQVWYFMIRNAWQCIDSLTLARTWGIPPADSFLGCTLQFLRLKCSFCMNCFLIFPHKVCRWQVSMIVGYWAITLFSTLCLDRVNANAPCYESFHLCFLPNDKSRYQWRFKCNSALNPAQIPAVDPRIGHMTSSYMASSQFTETFTITSITPHRIEIEPWARCHCVCLDMKHRLIWNMSYLGHSSGQVIWPLKIWP